MKAEFLLVSDLHVDEYDRFSKMISTEEYGVINSRLFWCLDIFDQIFDYGEANGCKTLLVGGDVFDKRGSIQVRAYTEVFLKLSRFVEAGWEIFAVVGNHDQALKTTEIHALACFPIEFAQTRFVWESRQGFRVGGVAFHERSADFFRELAEVAKQAPDVYLLHQGIHGAKIAGDEILSREDVRREDLRRFVGDDAWIFSGHYHIHQRIDPKLYFIGSSVPKDFGDRTAKGFLHFKNGVVQQVESRAPKFVTVEAEEVEGRQEELQGHYVQVRYEGEAPELKLPDTESLILVPRKVDREYQARVDISAENSPRLVFSRYLESFRLEAEKSASLNGALEEVLAGYHFAEKMGSAKVDFTGIHFENFLRFGSTSLNLEQLRGLILIEGENHDDPSSVSNGSGKSSIFEGLRWALFGSTLRGLAGDDVVNSEVGKDCSVQVEFSVDGQPYRVTRYRKHKKFKNQVVLEMGAPVESLDGSRQGSTWEDIRAKSDKDTTELITRLIGADERVFDSIVFLGYGFNNSFAGLTDKEQKQILENILGISYLTELQERAKARAVALKEACTEQSIAMSYLERQKDDKATYLKGLKARRESNFREEQQRLQKEIREKRDLVSFGESKQEEAEIRKLRRELEGLTARKLEIQDKLGDGLAVEQELLEVQRQAETALRNQERNVQEKGIQVQRLDDKLRSLLAEESRLKKSRERGRCPTCQQKLESPQELEKELARVTVEGRELSLNLNSAREAFAEARKVRDAELEAVEEVRGSLEVVRQAFKEFHQVEVQEAQAARRLAEEENNLARLKASANAAQVALRRAEEALEALETSNPYDAIIAEAAAALEVVERDLEAKAEAKIQTVLAYEHARFWEIAFSDKGSAAQPPIKSFILESVVPVLDEFARRYSETLSSGALEVRFNTISRLKSGEFREHFSVEVANRYGSIDYRGDSGGERRKVDIAIMFALHALSRIQTGTFFNVVCLDEVLDSLDKEGCDRVAELLRELATEVEKIFVITHNENLVSKFGTKIKAIKKDGYSTIFDYTSLDN